MSESCPLLKEFIATNGEKYYRCGVDTFNICIYQPGQSFEKCKLRKLLSCIKCPKCGSEWEIGKE